MKILIATYNVRGLCARTARTKLKNFITDTKPSLHILAVQEHKLRQANIDFWLPTLWPQATTFHVPAADGLHAEHNPSVIGGKGGVILLINPSIAPFITNHGILPMDRGIWIHLDTPLGDKLGAAAIYAPHTAIERAQLWSHMENTLDAARNWLITGDFNMITNASDQVGGTPKTITGEELTHWTSFTQSLDIRDTFKRTEGALRFTWDNRRLPVFQQQDQQVPLLSDRGRILKRLDRFYADPDFLVDPHTTRILPGSQLSDHLPVVATFQLQQHTNFKRSNYRMNVASLQDPMLKQNVAELWRFWERRHETQGTPPLLALKSCIKRTAKYCQLWGKKEARKRQDKQNRLTLKVHGLLLQLQADPANVHTQLKLESAQNDLATWENEKARWIQKHLDKKYEEEGERSSKLFFNSIKSRKKQTAIYALRDDAGVLHSNEEHIMEMATSYFSNILHEPTTSPQQLQDTEGLLATIQAQVSQEERDSLQKDFTQEELFTAAKLLGRFKCPGPDGVPLEFFLIHWDTVSPLLFKATSEGLQVGFLLPFFNKGVITLLQKEGDSTLLKNKRPITLLNTVYKIWAKALQLRLSPVLQRMITWEQNAFLPGRTLHSTVFLCNEAIFEAKTQEQDTVFLKIDFKKAFDTLRWDFLYKAMEKMQFGPVFISFVTALNNNASSCIRINNTCSNSFLITRSVRQGCPLSHLLFTIAIQVLIDAINFLMRNNMLKGVNLQSIGVEYCQGFFSDDSHLLLSADQQNLFNAKNLIDKFGSASGLQAGIQVLGDLTNNGTICLPLRQAASFPTSITPALTKAYDRLLDSTPKHTATFSNPSLFSVTPTDLPRWCCRLKDDAPDEDAMINRSHASAAFEVKHGKLVPAKIHDLPEGAVWHRAPVATFWNSQKKPPDRFLLQWEDNNALIASLRWRDQTGFLAAPNASIRSLASTDPAQVHRRLNYWSITHNVNPQDPARWTKLWTKRRPIKYGILQWYIFFRVVPTWRLETGDTWRLPQTPRDQPETWCSCCDSRAAEDIIHLFWNCEKAADIWKWAIEVLHIAFPTTSRWTPRFTHAILGEPIPDYCKIARRWWEDWRLSIIWIVWVQQNERTFRNTQLSHFKRLRQSHGTGFSPKLEKTGKATVCGQLH
ncbi:hypothetical protein R1sor_006003 [Riccia sorocarpa]|uniref:Reverse transcriptase domain-containing protein n=1 Tax=Riccia sorocarpa TaxID=122646 RepID=A0ABD3HPP3_9MARC